MTNNNNTTDKGNTMRNTFMVGDKVTYTPMLKGFGKPMMVTIVGASEYRDSMGQLCQAICRKPNGVDQIIHIEHLTHLAK
jgi:hypothetical protein